MNTTSPKRIEDARGMYSKKREETLAKVKAAVDYLREKGLKITRQAIADECDLGIATLDQEYIRDFLREYGAIKPRSRASYTPEAEILRLQKKLDSAHKEIQRLLDANTRDKETIDHWKKKSNDYQLKYERLLGQYQLAFERNHDRTFTQL